jgi:hypothetical protein
MAQDDFNAGAITAFMWIGTILLSIGSGVLAWNWIEPESFLGGVGFIILWGILSKVAHFIMFGIIMTIFRNR